MAVLGIHRGKGEVTGTNQPLARRDVLVICPDKPRTHELAEIFERRGLQVAAAADCRTGIASYVGFDLRMAIIVAEGEDPYLGPLIAALWSRSPQPVIWLIGNPFALRITEIIMGHGVAVLPPTLTADQFERIAFSTEAFRPEAEVSP